MVPVVNVLHDPSEFLHTVPAVVAIDNPVVKLLHLRPALKSVVVAQLKLVAPVNTVVEVQN